MTNEKFEELVEIALGGLPQFFKEKMENVDVVIEEWPSRYFARGRLLLGLYQGIPKTRRSTGYSMVLPDKITIFKGPIELVSHGDEGAVRNLVLDTVEHEIAHHFGISDSRLKELRK